MAAESAARPVSQRSAIGLAEADRIGRAIQLPWSKAIEISYKAVRTRFGRSLITAGGIVLAIAFLMATLARGSAIEGLKLGLQKRWRAVNQEADERREKVVKQFLEDSGGRKRVGDTIQKALAEYEAETEKAEAGKKAKKDKKAEGPVVKSLESRLAPKLLGDKFIRSLEKESQGLVEVLNELNGLKHMRMQLLLMGENPDAPVAAGVADRSSVEAKVRENWLMVLALVVAFVGIWNAMLMSVTERFREIGTMKCLGALDSFIFKLFLIEAAMAGFLGTVLGVAVGLVLAMLKLWSDFGAQAFGFLPWGGLGLSVLSAIGVGTVLAVLGALFPALIAARMEPVVAMRVDQ
jgi:hypothetical protein